MIFASRSGACIPMVVALEYKVCTIGDKFVLEDVVHDDVLPSLTHTVYCMVEEYHLPRLFRFREYLLEPSLVLIDRAQPHDVCRVKDDEADKREVYIIAPP